MKIGDLANRGVNRERRESIDGFEILGVTNVAERGKRVSRGVMNVAEREARESRDLRCVEQHIIQNYTDHYGIVTVYIYIIYIYIYIYELNPLP